MLIGEAGAVSDLWDAARKKLPRPRVDRPGQPVYAITDRHPPGDTGLRPATVADLDLLVPSCAAAHHEELGVDPLRRDPDGFRWRTRAQIEEGRSWLWVEDGVIRFKAEASAWTPHAVQLQQVWTDPPARRQGFAGRALRDLIRLLLERRPPSACSCGPRTRPRSGSTSRSACTTCSTTAPFCCEDACSCARPRARARGNAGDIVNGIPPGRGPLARGRRGGAALGAHARDGADRARRQLAAPARRRDAHARSRGPGRPSRRRAAPRRDRLRLVRGRPARRVPGLGVGAAARGRVPGRGRDACRRRAAHRRRARRAARPARGDDPRRQRTACRCAT